MDSSNQKVEQKEEKVCKKKRRLRSDFGEIIFIIFSIIFILGCCFFFGRRFIKYYRIYNPKSENGEQVKLLANSISESSSIVSEGDGLYQLSGSYIYKGEKVNNYLKFSGFMFRIMKINSDGSVRIILDEPINSLFYDKKNTDYIKSDINAYLNDVFLNKLDVSKLAKSSTCLDKVTNLNSVTCNNVNTDYYVSLPNVKDFLNSKQENSYMKNSSGESFWLSSYNNIEAWTSNGSNLSSSKVSNTYAVKPILTLKNSNILYRGTGTKEDPYVISNEKDNLEIASYVKLGDDLYIIYDKCEDTLSLTLASLYKDGNTKYRFALKQKIYDPSDDNSLAKYLNTTFLNSLSYKDIILDSKWYIGEYTNSYKDIYNKDITAKVGTLNIADLKFGNLNAPYYLLNASSDSDKVYIYGNSSITLSKITLSRAFRPAIKIKSSNIKSGTGSYDDPYKVVK